MSFISFNTTIQRGYAGITRSCFNVIYPRAIFVSSINQRERNWNKRNLKSANAITNPAKSFSTPSLSDLYLRDAKMLCSLQGDFTTRQRINFSYVTIIENRPGRILYRCEKRLLARLDASCYRTYWHAPHYLSNLRSIRSIRIIKLHLRSSFIA